MLKVFIIGYEEPHAVVGNFVWEDEKYLHLDDGGKKIKIPTKRIAYIEDWTELSEEKPVAPVAPPRQSFKPKTPEQPRTFEPDDQAVLGKSLRQMVADKFGDRTNDIMRVSQVEPEDLESTSSQVLAPERTEELLLVFSGAKEGKYPLRVDANVFEGAYTPMLGRIIFTNPAIQAFMSSEIMLEGLPTISGKTIEFKVKSSKTIGDVLAKADVLGKMLSLGVDGALNKPERKSVFDQGFSMHKSPFEQVPEILSKPKDSEEE